MSTDYQIRRLIQNVAVQQGHVDEVEEDLLPEALGWTLSRHVVDLTVAEVHPTHVLGVRQGSILSKISGNPDGLPR